MIMDRLAKTLLTKLTADAARVARLQTILATNRAIPVTLLPEFVADAKLIKDPTPNSDQKFLVYNLANAYPDAFRELIVNAKDNMPKFASSVAARPTEMYQKMDTLLVTQDGRGGVGVTSSGDLVSADELTSVFNDPTHANKNKNVIGALCEEATKRGADKLRCYDTILPGYYSNLGWSPVCKQVGGTFDYPADWKKDEYKKFNDGNPDRMFMVNDPNRILAPKFDPKADAPGYQKIKEELPAVASVDEAFKLQVEANAKIRQITLQMHETLEAKDLVPTGKIDHAPGGGQFTAVPVAVERGNDGQIIGVYGYKDLGSQRSDRNKEIGIFRIPADRVKDLDAMKLGEKMTVKAVVQEQHQGRGGL